MRQNFNREVLARITYLIGDADTVAAMPDAPVRSPFDDGVREFLNDISKALMANRTARSYSDVATLAFWLRKASTVQLKERFLKDSRSIRMGRGVAFHIAPSNVPVNFAYSLFAGMLTGNANIVRIPSRAFPQVEIIIAAIEQALNQHPDFAAYIVLARYGRSKEINDQLSAIADIRVVWGGDATIAELRESKLPPRSTEITFADRYSLAVIDSNAYMDISNKERAAQDFYNDTYFSDQNACTSPRIVVWTGSQKQEAKAIFWSLLHDLVRQKYPFQPIQAVNKLTSSYLTAMTMPGSEIEDHADNLIVRVSIPEITDCLMDRKEHSGYFLEYDCDDIMQIRTLCNDKRCQTIAYIGEKDLIRPLLTSGIKGVDRVVPVGKTMDFDLIWDGYDLVSQMTRMVQG